MTSDKNMCIYIHKKNEVNHLKFLIRQLYEIPGSIQELHDGQYLFHEEDPSTHLYIVRKGRICLMKNSCQGRLLAFSLTTHGSLIGELHLYEEEPACVFDAVAQCPSEVYAIELPVLEKHLEKRPALAVNLLKITSLTMRRHQAWLRDLILYGKKGALYATLIRLANSYGQKTEAGIALSITLTNQELANYSSMTRESLNRLLSELRRNGVIETRGSRLTIKDLDYLKQEINCENCPLEICSMG
jgi:CRP/FNR family transcriptional regulator